MTILRIIAAAGAVITLGLAGCMSDEHESTSHMASANYMSSGTYMRDSSAGTVMTTPEGRTV